MILECPECRTRYLVPDSAIGGEGRTVRCANCRHSWFQGPPAPDVPEVSPPLPAPEPSPPAPFAPPPAPEPKQPAAEPFAEPPPPAVTSSDYGAGYDAFAHQPPFRARRNPARRWTMLAIAAGLLMLIGAGAILWSGAPNLFGRFGAAAESPLRLRDNPIERRELDNGSELFAVSGQVINPSGMTQRVPDILVELKDAQGQRGRTVFSWKITPERRSLAPGGTVDFNSAKLDVPAGARQVDLSFAGDTD